MEKKNRQDGIIGLGKGLINVNSLEYKKLKEQIFEESKLQSKEEQTNNILLSFRFQLESYYENENNKLVSVGAFLKKLLKELNVKNKDFAKYIGYKESNLSALFNDKRKINIDLALVLGHIFSIKPSLWLSVQSKNELMQTSNAKPDEYKNYSIDGLLKKAS